MLVNGLVVTGIKVVIGSMYTVAFFICKRKIDEIVENNKTGGTK